MNFSDLRSTSRGNELSSTLFRIPTQIDSLSICRLVGNKLGDRDFVLYYLDQSLGEKDLRADISLAEGLPGLVLFYATLDQLFQEERWDATMSDYLQSTLERLENRGSCGASLFLGTGGICFATLVAAKREPRYHKLLLQLEKILHQEIHLHFLSIAERFCNSQSYVPPELYNLVEGISGSLLYLIMRREDPLIRKLCMSCLDLLVKLFQNDKVVDKSPVPAWYVSKGLHITKQEGEKYPDGSFSLSLPYGIPGVLSILAIAALYDLVVVGQLSLIQKIASWLRKQQREPLHGLCWDHTVKIGGPLSSLPMTRDAWCYGTPTIARSLFLAGRALQDSELKQFAKQAYEDIFKKPDKEWNLVATSFVHGRAGLLSLTYRMAQETGSLLLQKQVTLLEQDILRFYHSDHTFGFRTADIRGSEAEYQWIDEPGLFTGASGVALSLLLPKFGDQLIWDQAFLTH
jgi:lantibiotic modifying enzyme